MRTRPPARPQPRPGLLHTYADRLVAFEYSSGSSTGRIKPHTLLFIPGLGDGLGTVAYLNDIVASLEESQWSVFAPVLTSSYGGWGMSGLGRDIDEVAACVEYIRRYKWVSYSDSRIAGAGPEVPKVVIMGHSTGSQDVLQYISAPNPRPAHPVLDHGRRGPVLRPQVDGAVMQAPVSDRQAILSVLEEGNEDHTAEEMQAIYDAAITRAKRHTFEEYGTLDTIVPLPYTTAIGYPHTTAISSRRFLSLASPDSPQAPGEDDLFSSDLGEERLRKTFGVVHSRGVLRPKSTASLLVLYSGKDPSVPAHVDKKGLLRRWRRVVDAERAYWHRESGIIPGASHTLEGDRQIEQRAMLVYKLRLFLADIEHTP
ncbi:uncharacterized protein BDV17DRAFT_272419 [Aspergillus undulatus]|uniref:uncharacterized protein n=1 Tax=Aspergillus undulatus TaxID=1810928 RepID=UPI003CCD9F73